MTQPDDDKHGPAHLAKLREALESGRMTPVRRSLGALHPAEIARLLESLPLRERELVWGMVDSEDQGEVLLHVADDVRDSLIRGMSVEDIVAAAEDLDIDDLADFIEDLPEKVTGQILRAMDARDRSRLEQVLSFPPDTAGGLMNTDTVTVRPDVTLEVVQRYLRLRGELPDHTDNLYVVDRYGRYLGALPLAQIVTGDPQQLVSEIMDRTLASIEVTLPDTEVAKRFENFDLVSAPVVGENGVLLGRITIDDVVDVIRTEAEHNLMSMAGLDEEEDLFSPVRVAIRRRAVWLGINLVTAFAAAQVVGLFEATIAQVVALAVLMPIVASMGGIGGSQTLTLMIRGIALGQIDARYTGQLLRKELAVATINGVLWASAVAAVALVWFGSAKLALVIAMALVINQITGALSGVFIPLGLKRIGVDPALAGSVILTTVTDVVGFFAFLGLGAAILL